jgi:hypothetical protein
MHVCMYVCFFACIHVCEHVCTCHKDVSSEKIKQNQNFCACNYCKQSCIRNMHTCVHIYIHTCNPTLIHICMHMHSYILTYKKRTNKQTTTHIHSHTHTLTYIYIHTHTYVNSNDTYIHTQSTGAIYPACHCTRMAKP